MPAFAKAGIWPYERNGPRRVLLIQKYAGISKSQIPKAKLSKLSEAVIFTSFWRHFDVILTSYIRCQTKIIRQIFKGLQKATSILKPFNTYSCFVFVFSFGYCFLLFAELSALYFFRICCLSRLRPQDILNNSVTFFQAS